MNRLKNSAIRTALYRAESRQIEHYISSEPYVVITEFRSYSYVERSANASPLDLEAVTKPSNEHALSTSKKGLAFRKEKASST